MIVPDDAIADAQQPVQSGPSKLASAMIDLTAFGRGGSLLVTRSNRAKHPKQDHP